MEWLITAIGTSGTLVEKGGISLDKRVAKVGKWVANGRCTISKPFFRALIGLSQAQLRNKFSLSHPVNVFDPTAVEGV